MTMLQADDGRPTPCTCAQKVCVTTSHANDADGMKGDPRMRTRVLVESHIEVTTHACMLVTRGVTKGSPT